MIQLLLHVSALSTIFRDAIQTLQEGPEDVYIVVITVEYSGDCTNYSSYYLKSTIELHPAVHYRMPTV
jgi:hypothetical protein